MTVLHWSATSIAAPSTNITNTYKYIKGFDVLVDKILLMQEVYRLSYIKRIAHLNTKILQRATYSILVEKGIVHLHVYELELIVQQFYCVLCCGQFFFLFASILRALIIKELIGLATSRSRKSLSHHLPTAFLIQYHSHSSKFAANH